MLRPVTTTRFGILVLKLVVLNLSLASGFITSGYIEAQPVALKQLVGPGKTGKLQIQPDDATCGTRGEEQICTLSAPVTCQGCQSKQHPPESIVDKDTTDVDVFPTTYWQSSAWSSHPSPHHIAISMALKKDHRLTDDIAIVFRDPLPAQMILEKSRDYGVTWEALEYYSTNCSGDFEMVARPKNGYTSVTEVLCTNPYNDTEAVTDLAKVVTFPLVNRLNLLSNINGADVENLYTELDTNETLKNYLKVTDLRLRLMRPATTNGTIQTAADLRRYHYGIYDISTQFSCECNLHGDYCSLVVGEVMCHCLHHTSGKSCEYCAPGYQQSPWQPASFLPFPSGTANQCTVEPGFSTTKPPTTPQSTPQRQIPPGSTASQVQPTAEPNTTSPGDLTLDKQACEESPCNGNGMCLLEDTGLGFRCQCHFGYSGERCLAYDDPCRPNPCPQAFPKCYQDGGILHLCFPDDATLPGGSKRTTKSPPAIGPLSMSTVSIIIGFSVAIPVFCVLVVVLLWCTTWRHLHPTTTTAHTIKYMYDPELNGDAINGHTNTGYGVVSQDIDLRDLCKLQFDDETFFEPDRMSSTRGPGPNGWMLDEDNLSIGKLIYSGQFSYVCEGALKTSQSEQKVVVKVLKDEDDIESLYELKNELEVLANLGKHPNILWLTGMCTRQLENTSTYQTCLVTQYVSRGDMLRILRRCRSRRRDQEPFAPLPQEELLSFACDIAQGMRHISMLKYVHRNLCAKNVLITFNNKAKIGDFGAATDLPSLQDFVPYKEPRNKHQIRWQAYEAILEGVYTTRSDVWSFGMVLWEIATLGGIPYPKIKTSDLLNELRSHHRMEYPKHCSTELYDMMLRCWHRRPESRPSFDMLVTELKKLKGSGKKQINLNDYTFQMYVPVKLKEDLELDTTMTDSFV